MNENVSDRQKRAGHDSDASQCRVTARLTRAENGDIYTEYTVDGRVYHSADAVEEAVHG